MTTSLREWEREVETAGERNKESEREKERKREWESKECSSTRNSSPGISREFEGKLTVLSHPDPDATVDFIPVD